MIKEKDGLWNIPWFLCLSHDQLNLNKSMDMCKVLPCSDTLPLPVNISRLYGFPKEYRFVISAKEVMFSQFNLVEFVTWISELSHPHIVTCRFLRSGLNTFIRITSLFTSNHHSRRVIVWHIWNDYHWKYRWLTIECQLCTQEAAVTMEFPHSGNGIP